MVTERREGKVGEIKWSNFEPMELHNAGKPAPRDAQPVRPAPLVGSTSSAPERKLGTQKEPCVFKPVMTAEDVENCK